MGICSAFIMWAVVFFFYRKDDLPEEIFRRTSVVFWTCIYFIFYAAVGGISKSGILTICASVFFVSSAVLDHDSGYVYSICCYLFYAFIFFRVSIFKPDTFLFYGYLKVMELLKVYGAGDMLYLLALYLFNDAIGGKLAIETTIVVFLLAFLLHWIQFRKDGGKRPFTPHLCLAEMFILYLEGGIF